MRLSAITRISDWPFALKMGICPALAMLALLGLAVYGIEATAEQARLIRVVVDEDLRQAALLAQSAARLQAINGRLYRLATLQAVHGSPVMVEREVDALTRQTGALADGLDRYAQATHTPDDREALHRLIPALRTYGGTISVIGSMLEIDFASAVEMIRPFDDNANSVLAGLDSISRRMVHEAEARAAASATAAEQLQWTLAAVAAGVSLALITLAALLTRATVRSVRQIAGATSLVAKGDQSLDIEALHRADELGTIVRSLGAFQANVAQVAFLAHHDALTGLPNRILLNERTAHAVKLLDRGHRFALFLLDLDHFKEVNDTLGHPVGDELLKQVAERLQDCVREGDTVSRLGGDEFAVLLPGMSDTDAADQLARRMLSAIAMPCQISRHQVNISTCIGITLAPRDGAYPDKLLKNADMALYRAKRNAHGSVCFFEPAMDAEQQARWMLEVDMRRAIIENEFELYYQPLVNVRTRAVSGFEALIRWQHPTRGLVAPDAFIPLAESSGLIVPLGQWVLRQACLDATSWPVDLRVAVNLSSVQFKDRRLVETVQDALDLTGLPGRQLELEITETVLLKDSESTLATLHRLRGLGVRISMDDFGTGYSSMSYLRRFPFDKIKIDQSFVRDLPDDVESSAIVRAVIGLSNSLGMTVTAEGVETEAQAEQLAREACTDLQGYLFSKPVRAMEIPGLLERLGTPCPAVA